MRAAWHAEFGAAAEVLQVGELDTPEPGEGDVLVRLGTSGINPLDVKKRAGARGNLDADRAIPHYDGAGVIEAVGSGVAIPRASASGCGCSRASLAAG
jgi:NADPH2:quinone reductase